MTNILGGYMDGMSRERRGFYMQARVKEWGNSQEIRLPKEVFRHKTLEERAAEFDGKLLLDGEYI